MERVPGANDKSGHQVTHKPAVIFRSPVHFANNMCRIRYGEIIVHLIQRRGLRAPLSSGHPL